MARKPEALLVLAGIVLGTLLMIAVRYEPYTFIRRDASFYATISRGLVTHFSLDQRKVQPQSWYSGQHPGYPDLDMYWSNVSVGRDGIWYPKHSYLISFAAAPFYALFGVPGFLIFNALCVIAMLWSSYLLAVRFAGPLASAAAVLLMASSRIFSDHTYLLSLDVFNATLIALGTLALFERQPVAAGLLLGLALWARPITIALVVPVTVVGVYRRLDRRQLLRFVVALAGPLLAAALANTVMYGAPWVTAYDRVLVVENRVPGIASHRELFSNSLGAGFRLMFRNAQHGLTANAWPVYVGAVGLVPLLRRDWKLALALAVAVLGFIAGYIRYRYFNARFSLAWQALLVVPAAVLIGDTLGWALRRAGYTPRPITLPRPSWPSIRRLPRALPWALAGGLVVGAVVVGVARSRRDRLSGRIAEAAVFRNDFPCDYFNMTHLAWECSRLDRGGDEYTGLALRPGQCRLGGEHRRWIVAGAPPDGGTRRIVFPVPRPGPLTFELGLEAGASNPEPCLTVSYGARPPERLCAPTAGEIQRRVFEPPPTGGPATLEIVVQAPAPRALCFDGSITP